jgi:serine/threonine protein kinase
MEVCSKGNLLQYSASKQWKPSELLLLMRNMLTTVQQLHQINIAHLNLSAENWLVDEKNGYAKVKLTDFGRAHLVPRERVSQESQETMSSLSEEQLKEDARGLGTAFSK